MKLSNQIVLIRHAESEANTEGILCGQLDIALSEKGKLQAKTLSHFNTDGFEILSSPLQRALETAKGLNAEHPPKQEDLLKEIDTGDYSFLTYDSFYLKHPNLRNIYKYPDFMFPNGESINSAKKRIEIFVQKYSNELRQNNMIIIAHGGILNLLLISLLQLDTSHYPLAELENCKASTLSFFEDKFRITSINKEL